MRYHLVTAVIACSLVSIIAGAGASSSVARSTAKTPIRIMSIQALSGVSSVYPQVAAGAQSAAAAINKAGGVNGHTIKIDVCDDQQNPNLGTQCGEEAVHNHDVAVTGVSQEGQEFLPILAAAHIPEITSNESSPDGETYPNVFTLGAGADAEVAAGGSLCAKLGYKKIGLAVINVSSANTLIPGITTALAQYGLTVAKTVEVPPTATDLTPYAAQLVGSTDCITDILSINELLSLISALHQQGSKEPVMSVGGVSASTFATIGQINNVYGVDIFPPATDKKAPGVAQFLKEVNACSCTKGQPQDAKMEDGWSAVHLVAQELKGRTKLTGANLIRILGSSTTVRAPLLPPTNYTYPVTWFSGVTRLFTQDLIFTKWVNGVEIPYYGGKYINFFSLKNAPALQ